MCRSFYQKLVQKVGLDKVAHFAVSSFLVLALGHFFHWAISAGVALALGLLKEFVDTPFDKKDLLADAAGILIGIIILIV